MKYLLFLIAILTSKFCLSQNYKLPDGDYMDSSLPKFTFPCQDKNVFYYQVGAKYQESSTSILKKAKDFTSNYKNNFSGNGYITFQFMIDCTGKMQPGIKVLQTDEDYKKIYFDKELIDQLFAFIKTLDKWKIARINRQEVPLAYNAYITFKIQDGKVVNIIP